MRCATCGKEIPRMDLAEKGWCSDECYKKGVNDMKIHNLKCSPKYFQDVWDDIKTFELRKNDRGFEVGDTIILGEWDGEYTGRKIFIKISYVLDDIQFLQPDYVALGIRVVGREPNKRDLERSK